MMINKLSKLISAVGCALAFYAVGADAQQVPGPRNSLGTIAATTDPVAAPTATSVPTPSAAWVIRPDSETVRVPLNKVVSVRLPGEVRNVIVANPDIADIILPSDGARDRVYVLSRAVGSTSIVFEDDQGNILFQGDIQVDVDVEGIKSAIKETLPAEKISVSAHRNGVFLKGFVRSASASNMAVNVARRFVAETTEVINNLEILGSQQVILQVRVAEIKRTTLKGLGVNLGIGDGTWQFDGSTSASSFFFELGQSEFLTGAINLGAIPYLTDITINALEDQGFAKVLAEPTLTALSGETASFLAGGSFPMTDSYDAETNTVTFVQTPFGVALNFTPVVLDEGRISLRVKTTVSDRDDTVATTTSFGTIPGLTEKTTETTVELPSGGSLMLSGLIQNDLLNYVEGIPGFKDLPILGQLFRSEGFKNEETELVVLITTYLAKPVSNFDTLSAPTDGFAPSSDLDFYLLGRLHKRYTQTELPPYATPLAGPFGHIME